MALDKLNEVTGMQWYYPGFARYGADMARFLTNFLYSDPAYPLKDMPANWSRSGMVRIVSRTLDFAGSAGTGLSTGSSQTLNSRSFVNGRNFIVIGRTASAYETAALTAVDQQLIDLRQTQADGTIIDDTAPLANLVGSGELPGILPVPDCILGTAQRNYEVTNRWTATSTISITFQIAMLDVIGR